MSGLLKCGERLFGRSLKDLGVTYTSPDPEIPENTHFELAPVGAWLNLDARARKVLRRGPLEVIPDNGAITYKNRVRVRRVGGGQNYCDILLTAASFRSVSKRRV